MSRRITIDDVAREAGVGRVTVSYVLNGRSKAARISSETTERVLEVARTLKYRPNALARMLATKRTDTVAVVFQSGNYFSSWSGFTSEAMGGISEAMFEEGCDLMLHTKQVKDALHEADCLSDGRVDGALILRDEDDPTLRRLIENNFPCVQFFTSNGELDIPSVDCDNVLGGQIAARHLRELGHTKVAYVGGSPRSTSSNDRMAGFQKDLETSGISFNPDWHLYVSHPDGCLDTVLDLFLGKEKPTALFVWSDDVAIAIMRALTSAGISVPDQVSIVGFDSGIASESSVPRLTSVHQPIRRMAAEAARLLISVVRGREISQPKIVFQPVLHVRESTAPLTYGKGSRSVVNSFVS